MMHTVIWVVLIVSVVLLLVVLLRNRSAFQWLGKTCLHVVFAALLIYVLNLFSGYTSLTIPYNAVTVGIVGTLGLPGLGLLAAVKLIMLG
jgi:inhibitor of the pro-sigma K processing machinery